MSYKKTEDLLDLAIWMQSNREGVSISDIMNRFKVSRRTAERMRNMIIHHFIQAEEAPSYDKKKRWRIPQGTLKDLFQFSADDLSVLNLAKNILEKENLTEESKKFQKIIDKITASIKTDTFRKIEPDAEILLEAQGFAHRPGPKIKIASHILDTIKEAILSCHQVRITYQNKNSKKISQNDLKPYGFLYGDRNHYLVAAHSDGFANGEPHNFILMNIKDVTILPDLFVYPENFSLKEYSERSFGAYQEEPFDVEWVFDQEVAEEASHYIFHPKQTLMKNSDGTVTVKFKAGGALEMSWHLFTWGEHVKVIKPKDWYNKKIKGEYNGF